MNSMCASGILKLIIESHRYPEVEFDVIGVFKLKFPFFHRVQLLIQDLRHPHMDAPAVALVEGDLHSHQPSRFPPLYARAEIGRQLRGEAGERQVKDAQIGLCQAEHGMVNGAVVMLLES